MKYLTPLLAFLTLFALLAPAPAQSLEELRQETNAVAAELTKLREVAAAKTKLELLKTALADAKKGKKFHVAKVAPTWPPELKVGEVIVTKSPAGVWWFVERREGSGLLSLHEYGKGERARLEARKFAVAVRKNAAHARIGKG